MAARGLPKYAKERSGKRGKRLREPQGKVSTPTKARRVQEGTKRKSGGERATSTERDAEKKKKREKISFSPPNGCLAKKLVDCLKKKKEEGNWST